MKTNTPIKMGRTYRIQGHVTTIERVAHGYIVRNEFGQTLGQRSTRKAALKLATSFAK